MTFPRRQAAAMWTMALLAAAASRGAAAPAPAAPASAAPPAVQAAPSAAASSVPIPPDIRAMGDAIENDMSSGDGSVFDHYFDDQVFIANVTKGIAGPMAEKIGVELSKGLKLG